MKARIVRRPAVGVRGAPAKGLREGLGDPSASVSLEPKGEKEPPAPEPPEPAVAERESAEAEPPAPKPKEPKLPLKAGGQPDEVEKKAQKQVAEKPGKKA